MNPVHEILISNSEQIIKSLKKQLPLAKTKDEQQQIQNQIRAHEAKIDNLLATA